MWIDLSGNATCAYIGPISLKVLFFQTQVGLSSAYLNFWYELMYRDRE